ncbi:glycoside hydrolase family 16 protein [Roseibacillus ishigakijimensis]|uniref:Glycoside hydrolase family 16 protein n=1 Tax=Roseibacillus ishigakijimensis TaxID=454146 RepID=A0A934RRG7_9BACT|nr:glycoside hydrolase family 16 protein [Roseibacillus ishigakijimensis]MBK1833181.1 glycoside hydrolase family 16 protein [Roseibacillus ishigakijimensis]
MKTFLLSSLWLGGLALAEDPTWQLVWQDEFSGDQIDASKWDYQLGNGFYSYDAQMWIAGWGNGERQYYTDSPNNAFLREGHLVIRALKQSLHQCGYTSARLRTKGQDGRSLFAQRYGRFEVRAHLPSGQGLWPAIWLLPEKEDYGPWAASGEIDLMEARGQEPGKVLGTIHYGARWPLNQHSGGEYLFPEGEDFTSFHTYALEWEPGEIRWFVDGHLYSRKNFWWSSSAHENGQGLPPQSAEDLNAWPAPFNQPFHLLLNLAVGGQFPGDPEATTEFPAEFVIDYVRVYQREGGAGEVQPRGEGEMPFAPAEP